MHHVEVYRRADGKWAWRLKAENGQTIATDGGQGYENKTEAEEMAEFIVQGGYAYTFSILGEDVAE